MSRLQSQIVCHDNQIETTAYCLTWCHETWELHKLTGSGGMLFLIVFDHLSDEHS